MRQKDQLTAHIPSTVIDGFPDFHEARHKIYAEDGSHEESLQELLERTTDTTGTPLIDVVLAQITAEDAARTSAERLERAKALSDTVLSVVMSPDGDLEAVQERKEIPVDTKAVARQRSMAERIGYGPKQNDSSFRLGSRGTKH